MKTYAGIGSRVTPKHIQKQMTKIAMLLDDLDYTLRSGGALGADTAFEYGAMKRSAEIYLPWPGFNDHLSPLHTPTPEAFKMAEEFHPNWKACSSGVRKFHARNCHQVLGMSLRAPVEFLICWTIKGLIRGGTSQAIRVAEANDILVINMGAPYYHYMDIPPLKEYQQ